MINNCIKKSSTIKLFFLFILAVIITFGLSVSLQSLLADAVPPKTNPPICAAGDPGCDEPINIGSTGQGKLAGLVLNSGGYNENGLVVFSGNAVFSGKVGIGTATPGANLDVRGTSIRDTNYSAYKIIAPVFTHGAANQKIDLYMTGVQQYWGTLDVTIVDSYSYQNAAGGLTKRFYLGLNPAGAMYSVEARYIDEGGKTADNYAISDIRWDAANSRYYITIVHRAATGNSPIVHLKATLRNPNEIDNFLTFTAGSVYTTDTTVYPRPYITFDNNVGIGTSTPAYKLDVQGGQINASGGLCINGDCKTAWSSEITYYVGATTAIYSGNNSGNIGYAYGYAYAHARCNAVFSGSHVCAAYEILNTIARGGTRPDQDVWIINGPPAYTELANDCDARTNGTDAAYGAYWQKPGIGYPDGRGLLLHCNESLRLACCR